MPATIKKKTPQFIIKLILSYMPLTGDKPFFTHQLFQCKGSSCMQLLCRDTDFSSQSKLFTVCKSRRCVGVYNCCIHFIHKPFTYLFIFRNNGFRMFG